MTLLLLAGTGEARQIAQRLKARDVIASLSGATRMPAPLAVPTQIGGFGGDDGFRTFLREKGIRAVLDATHPFAQRITARTASICAALDVPYLQFLRPAWVSAPRDIWTAIAQEEDAAKHIPSNATVFLGTGRQTLDRFANLVPRQVICRQIDPPDGAFPFKGGRFLVGRPPFSVADEMALFQDLGVDWLVVKNAGGAASETKLIAARQLEIPVLMLTRPARGDWPIVETIDAAVAWADSR